MLTAERVVQPVAQHAVVNLPSAHAITPSAPLVEATGAGRAKRAEAQHNRSQLALNVRLGSERVAALHALLDDCFEGLDAKEAEASGGY
jgi:hypothetical protein